MRPAGVLLAVLALLLLALSLAGPAAAARPCWRDVLDEWTKTQEVSTTHPIECYDAALENLPNDIRDYTDAYDQISSARQDALRGGEDRRELSGSGAGGNDPDDPGGLVGNNSDSIPLPLLILGGLAALLMAAGGAGLLARRFRS